MTEERKTLVLAVASWVLPGLMTVVPFVVEAICPVSELKSVPAIKAYGVALFAFVIGVLAAALVLSVKARRRSRALHQGRFYRHATVGLFASLCLLFCWGVTFVFLLWTVVLR